MTCECLYPPEEPGYPLPATRAEMMRLTGEVLEDLSAPYERKLKALEIRLGMWGHQCPKPMATILDRAIERMRSEPPEAS